MRSSQPIVADDRCRSSLPIVADGRCRSLPMAVADRCRWPLPIVADGRCRSLPTRPRPTPVSRRARSARSNCRCADGRGPRATCRSRQQCYTAVIAAARSIAGRASRGVPGDGAFIKLTLLMTLLMTFQISAADKKRKRRSVIAFVHAVYAISDRFRPCLRSVVALVQ